MVSDNEPGRPDGETEMTTLTSPFYNTYPTADTDTVRMPLPTVDHTDHIDHTAAPPAPSSTPPACGPAGWPPPPSPPSSGWSAPS